MGTFNGNGKVPGPLGFGAAPLGSMNVVVSEEDAEATISAAWDAGIRYFDTAPFYGYGLSEHRLGQGLRWRPREEFVLSTKVGRLLRPHPAGNPNPDNWRGGLPFKPEFDYSYDGAMRSFEDSLQRLSLPRIDIAFIHDIDRGAHKDAYDTLAPQAVEGAYRALDALRAQGVVSGIGVGINDVEAPVYFLKRCKLDYVLMASRYTLLEQGALAEVLPLCLEQGVKVIIGGPYNSGILATGVKSGTARYDYGRAPAEKIERAGRIEAVCDRFGVPLPAAALQFPLAHAAVAAVIPGAISADEVRRNVELMRRPIPGEFWAALKQEGLLPEEAPVPAGG